MDQSTFEKNYLQDFDAESHYGSSQVVEYSRVTFDQKCKGQLSEAKTRILIGLDLYFNKTFSNIHIYFRLFVHRIDRYEYILCFQIFSLSSQFINVWFREVISIVCLLQFGIGVTFIKTFSWKSRLHPPFIRHGA